MEEINLTKEDEIHIEEALMDIDEILHYNTPPKVIKLPYCKKCAYYEYCYIKENE